MKRCESSGAERRSQRSWIRSEAGRERKMFHFYLRGQRTPLCKDFKILIQKLMHTLMHSISFQIHRLLSTLRRFEETGHLMVDMVSFRTRDRMTELGVL